MKPLLSDKSRIREGAQPEIFKGKGGFMELGHFEKLFVKYTRKKAPQGKFVELFLLDALKNTF